MSRIKRFFWGLGYVFAFGFMMSGCVTNMMVKTEAFDPAPSPNKAIVTVIRSKVFFGDGISFGIWQDENFAGILNAGTYIQLAVDPGEHIFLARAENWSCLKANLEAGKRYYITGKIIPGVWKGRVALDPVTKSELDDPNERRKVEEWMAKLIPQKVIEEKRASYTAPRIDEVRKALEDVKSGASKFVELKVEDCI